MRADEPEMRMIFSGSHVGQFAMMLAAATAFWVIVGSSAIGLLPVVRCASGTSEQVLEDCKLALDHSVVKWKLRETIYKRQIEAFVDADDQELAIAAATDMISEGLAGAEIFVLRGKLCDNLGRFDDASEDFSKALEVRPGDEGAFDLLMNVLVKAGRVSEANVVATNFAAEYAKASIAHYWRGRIAYLNDQLPEALQHYVKAISITPSNSDYHNDYAISLEDSGRNSDALVEYDEAIRIDPTNVVLLNNRAELNRRENKLADAIRDFKKSLSIHESDNAVFGLARTFMLDGQYSEGYHWLDRAEEMDPADGRILNLAVFPYYDREQYREIRKVAAEFIGSHGENPYAINVLADVDLQEGSHEKALAGFKSILKDWDKDYGLRADIGYVLLELHRPLEAMQYFDESVKIAPGRALPYTARARGRIALGHWEDALVDANKAISISQRNGFAQATRALVFAGLKNESRALEDFETALALRPRSVWIRSVYTDFLIDAGHYALAEIQISHFLRSNGSSPAALALKKKLKLAQENDLLEAQGK